MKPGMTILITARNAGATIERAVGSCLPEVHCPIVLVDDHCTDDTVPRAKALAGSRLRVVRAPEPGGVGMARQAGLDSVDTELATWLDADDEWIVGRAARLEAMLGKGYDIATEAIDLHDGASGRWLRRLTIPDFLRRPGADVRLFERNFLPGDTPVAFRTDVFHRAGGYDTRLLGAESFDVLLRSIACGARLVFGRHVGYRIFAYSGSVSRSAARQRAALTVALRKQSYEAVRALYRKARYSDRVAAWGLVSMALFRDEPLAGLRFLDEASPSMAEAQEVLEPEGPWAICEGWRRAFHRGTLLLMANEGDALAELTRAERLEPTAEGSNNLGIALWRKGQFDQARRSFALAVARRTDYVDASTNLHAIEPGRITTHLLRREPSRTDYHESAA